jgi:hypothetical protein
MHIQPVPADFNQEIDYTEKPTHGIALYALGNLSLRYILQKRGSFSASALQNLMATQSCDIKFPKTYLEVVRAVEPSAT